MKRTKSKKKDRKVIKEDIGKYPEGYQPTLPKNKAQSEYMQLIKENCITFGIGSSGTGKTYIAMSMAIDALCNGDVKQIVITRPIVESSKKSIGALPGEKDDKFAPYLVPLQAVVNKKMRNGRAWFDCQKKLGNIKVEPLNFMQGSTFDNSFVVADEMQNSDTEEMFMLLSRTGENTTVVVNGDYKMQKMIRGTSGLEDAENRLKNLKSVEFYPFSSEDIVRSGISRSIIKRYETT
jgi:phosphate starvation-inducible protein PhoH and related proteins